MVNFLFLVNKSYMLFTKLGKGTFYSNFTFFDKDTKYSITMITDNGNFTKFGII